MTTPPNQPDARRDGPPGPTPTGIMLIDKPIGPTSMDACRRIRWRLVQAGAPKRIKVGHGGTLDPLATGLLVILVGKATPLCERIMQGEKDYAADVDLSAFSTTDDLEGEKTAVQIARVPSDTEVRAACDKLTGTIMQRPPAYSAIKIDGQRAYDLARSGKATEIAARPVQVRSVGIVEYAFPRLRLTITCGKGVYIRSMARDLGALLGTGGHLTALRRTRIGAFSVDDARPLNTLPERLTQADLLPIPAAGA